MSLQAGVRLGPYEMVSPLGAGGMGEVYRATDTRLRRDVAIKILPPELAGDEQRLRRFEGEAQAISALNHPNILTVFDVGHEQGLHFLVTELVDGVTLRRRLSDGPLVPKEVVEIGAQVADGLAAAHDAGYVHRDIKPDNVMVLRDGRIKILDFGLAKPFGLTGASGPTRTAISDVGVVVGTVGYLAPEQVRGESADARSDLFSLGTVLHELLTAAPPFAGSSTVETLNAILKESPSEIPARVPAGLRQVVEHCLEKRPERRFQSARDLAFALRAFSTSGTGTLTVQQPTAEGWKRAGRMLGVAASGLILAAAAYSVGRRTVRATEAPLAIHLEPFAADAALEMFPAWSPDGRSLAYVHSDPSNRSIMIRRADGSGGSVAARGLADDPAQLFWSADGSRIYWVGESKLGLSSVGVVGGPVRVEDDSISAADFSRDGRVFAAWKAQSTPKGDLVRLWIGSTPSTIHAYIPAPLTVTQLLSPNILRIAPDGRKLLLWVEGAETAVYIVPIPEGSGPARRIFEGATLGRRTLGGASWMPDSRRVVISIEGGLWLGDTEANSLNPLTIGTTPMVFPAVSPGGDRLAFTESVTNQNVIELSLSGGDPKTLVGTSQYDGSGAVSPTTGRLAYVSGTPSAILARSDDGASDSVLISPADLGSQSADFRGLSYSPDGDWLAFAGIVGTPNLSSRIYVAPARGGTARPISPASSFAWNATWSPDSKQLASALFTSEGVELWIFDRGGTQPARKIDMRPVRVPLQPEWSPSGEWIAAMDKAGTALIRVTTGEVRGLPHLGSAALFWSHDSRTLYGVTNEGEHSVLKALDVQAGTIKTAATYGQRFELEDSVNQTIKFNPTPRRDGFVTTRMIRTEDVWMLSGLR